MKLELYNVDYTDPTNFIYVMNNTKIDDYKNVNGKVLEKLIYPKNVVCIK